MAEKEIEEIERHYQELCFGESNRLGMNGIPPFKEDCKNCPLVYWHNEWELIKQIDSNNQGDELQGN